MTTSWLTEFCFYFEKQYNNACDSNRQKYMQSQKKKGGEKKLETQKIDMKLSRCSGCSRILFYLVYWPVPCRNFDYAITTINTDSDSENWTNRSLLILSLTANGSRPCQSSVRQIKIERDAGERDRHTHRHFTATARNIDIQYDSCRRRHCRDHHHHHLTIMSHPAGPKWYVQPIDGVLGRLIKLHNSNVAAEKETLQIHLVKKLFFTQFLKSLCYVLM